ncbi:hypothetical protein AB3S75_045251 [Citrus x aurantiifolia]
MATMLSMALMLSAAFFMGCTNLAVANYGDASAGVIHVGGQVLCQNCFKSYKEWVNGSNPLKGVTVSLTCMDDRSRVMCYKSDETDEQGQFYMTVDRIINGKELKAKLCSVRLVSSTHADCSIATNFAGGKIGVKLMRSPTSMFRNIIKYRVGPFYYTTPMCEKPDTNDSQSDEAQGSYY